MHLSLKASRLLPRLVQCAGLCELCKAFVFTSKYAKTAGEKGFYLSFFSLFGAVASIQVQITVVKAEKNSVSKNTQVVTNPKVNVSSLHFGFLKS